MNLKLAFVAVLLVLAGVDMIAQSATLTFFKPIELSAERIPQKYCGRLNQSA